MRIGLTQRILTHRGRAYDALEHGWYTWLGEHELVPVPNVIEQNFQRLSYELDALIITGGDDSALRRATELKIARHMIQRQCPVLGVCHGAFLLTEILGGEVVAGGANHRDTEHDVIYWQQPWRVNSHHDLLIRRAPSRAQILCRDTERNIEAWIDGLTAAVVWHPERMTDAFLPNEIALLLKI